MAGSPPAPDSPLPLADDDDDGDGAGHGGAANRARALSSTAWSGTNGRLAEGEAAGARRGSWSRPPRSLRRRATVFVRMNWQSSTQALVSSECSPVFMAGKKVCMCVLLNIKLKMSLIGLMNSDFISL